MSRWRARVAELATAALVAGAIGVGVAAPAHALTRAPLVPVPGLAGLWFEGMISQVDSSQRLVVAGVEMDRTHGYTSACSGSTANAQPFWSENRLMVRRYLGDGSPDPSFGDGGNATVDLRAFGLDVDNQYLAGMVVTTSGDVEMLATGTRLYCDVDYRTTTVPGVVAAAVRLSADGRIDTSFGNGGLLPLSDGAQPVHMTGSDTLWVADPLGARPIVGSSLGTDVLPVASPNRQMAMIGNDVAYTTFNAEPAWGAFMHPAVRVVDVAAGLSTVSRAGTDGLVPVPTPGASPGGTWQQFVSVDSQGRFVVASAQTSMPGAIGIYVSRIARDSNGAWAVDPTFGAAGVTTLPLPANFYVRDMVVDNQSRPVLLSTGWFNGTIGIYFRLTRLTASGIPDAAFATDGTTTMPRPEPIAAWNGAGLAIDSADRPYALLPIETQISLTDSIDRPSGSPFRATSAMGALSLTRIPTDRVRRFTVGGLLDPTWKGNPDAPAFLPAPDLRFALGKPITVKALPGTLSWGTTAKTCTQRVGKATVSPSLRAAPIPLRNGVATRQSVTMIECSTGYVVAQTASRTAHLVVTTEAPKGWKATASKSALGKSELTTRTRGARLVLPVVGTSVALVAAKGPARGSFTVLLDGKKVAVVDLLAKKASAPVTVWVSQLKPGKHTVTVVSQGTKGRPLVAVDALATLG